MLYSPLGWLVRKGLEKVLGKAAGGLTGGDPLDPDYEFVEV